VTDHSAADAAEVLRRLGVAVFERGWLSSNNIVFGTDGRGEAAVVDTGYAAHAAQTAALVRGALGGRRLERVVNTHLHSDHCGGNAALQAEHGCPIAVPAASFEAVRAWDEGRLTFQTTDQRCDRFEAHSALHPGDEIELGARAWQVLATPGHDPEAVVFFEPRERVLIAGDALWRDRLAIIFPELVGAQGFGPARDALATIEALDARVVIPGHGAPFTDAAAAIASARGRLDLFEQEPRRHFGYATRALAMFHMLEHRRRERGAFEAWMLGAPILAHARRLAYPDPDEASAAVHAAIERLLADGALRAEGDMLVVVGSA
jgi:glyoxylase-like metal-dependent hydrolase (beta-lactamase superfamily II)